LPLPAILRAGDWVVRLAERRRAAHMEDMDSTLLRRCVVGLAVATLVPLLATAVALGQTNTETIQRTLGNLQSLPPASEPYQRSTDDSLYRQQLRDQAQQSRAQAAQTQQQLIDESGQVLQQNLATQRQQQLQQQQQFYDYQLQSLQQRRIQQQH
jgi:hypothetical protein